MNEIIPKDFIGKGRIYKFEEMELVGPEKFDDYLKHFYGDYMTPPPMDERNRHNVTEG